MSNCPCGSAEKYENCCGPFINSEKNAATAEALMRSRYTAYTKTAFEYLLHTTHPSKTDDYDHESIKKWSEESEWHGLEIIETINGGQNDDSGSVEFIARYSENGQRREHHEIGNFKKQDGQWYYYDGQTPNPVTFVRKEPKIGRNAPCPCNSGKKYKKCCGR